MLLLLRLLVLVVAVALTACDRSDLLVFLLLRLSSELSSCAGIAESPPGSPKEPMPSMMACSHYCAEERRQCEVTRSLSIPSVRFAGWWWAGVSSRAGRLCCVADCLNLDDVDDTSRK